MESEKNGSLHFLGIKRCRENGKFAASVYRKETFSGVYTNFTSFILLGYKFGLSYTLFHWCFCLVYYFSKFHIELEKFSKINYEKAVKKL